jgi:DNA-directed RNA polymerase subunit RPC12/RpoP
MNCPNCGHELDVPEDTQIVVCEECGTPVEVNQDEED